jgi:hypothetical protein
MNLVLIYAWWSTWSCLLAQDFTTTPLYEQQERSTLVDAAGKQNINKQKIFNFYSLKSHLLKCYYSSLYIYKKKIENYSFK